MPLINTSVPNLIQGVSQQPDATRFDGQCELQENALSSVASGLKKRPNTRHIAKLLDTAIDENSFVHFINRSDTEKYCITQDNNTLRVHNALTGVQCTVTEQGTSDFTISNNEVSTAGTYLDSTLARKNIKPLTVGDSTFLLNKDKETALNLTESTSDLSDEALIFIKQGDYKKKYGFEIKGKQRTGGGQSATIRVKSTGIITQTSGFGSSWALELYTGNATYFPTIKDGGSGFAVDEIVDIELPASRTVTNTEQNWIRTHTLVIHTQPTLKVLTVDSEGVITSAEIEEAGAFHYYNAEFDATAGTGFATSSNEGMVESVVSSTNTTTTSSEGTNASIEVKQTQVPAWNNFGFYSTTNASYTLTQANIKVAGSGFAVGDIIDIPLPASSYWDDSATINGDSDAPDLNYLNLVIQPTIRVLSVGSNGEILTQEIAEGGRFGYGDWVGFGYGTQENGILSSFWGDLLIPTTNNTTVAQGTDNSFVGKVLITSDEANGNDGSVIDSSVILQRVASNTTDINVSAYFDRDSSNTESNLLILKPKQLTTGQSVVDYFKITPIDGLSGEGIGVVHREVSSITDLPLVAPHGHKVKVVGDSELGQDDFYCEFNVTSEEIVVGEVGQGTWVECAGALVKGTIDETTMPRQLINVKENVFQIRRMSFGSLQAGDGNTNPSPSFINNKINNMFLYKNRLGLLCRDAVILSESGFGGFDSLLNRQSFNFFRTTVSTLLDSDPIDVMVSSSRVTNLKAARGFQENLILFAENGQFALKGGDLLTPKTVSINAITNFSYEDQVEPLPLGSYIYFPFTRGAFTGVSEFTVNASTDNYDSVEITEHVPSYIPKNIIDIAGTTSEDTLALLSGDEKSTLYIYNYFWNNSQKVLSAWSKFTFTGEIRGIEFIESTLYAVITNNGETNLVEMPLESGLSDAAGYVTHLDMRVAASLAGEVLETSVNNTPESGDSYTPFNGSWSFGGLSTTIADTAAYGNGVELENSSGTYGTATITLSTPIPSGTTVSITSTVISEQGTWRWEFLNASGQAASGTYTQGVTVTGNDTVTTTAEATQLRIRATNNGTLKVANIAVTTQGYIPASTTTTTTVVTPAEDTITLPYTPEDNSVQVYTTDGLALNCTNSGSTVTLSSPVTSDTDVWVGIPYTMKYTFSEQLFKAKAGNGKSPSNAAKMRIRNGSLYYDKSAYFKVKVTPKFRDTYENIFTPDVVGSSVLGSLSLDSGFYRFPVFTKPQDTTITIENESALPSTFQSAEFESFVHSRSNRYG